MTENLDNFIKILSDNDSYMPNRFAALFHLRTIGNERAVETIIKILTKTGKNTSDLLEHELAYVLGQIFGVKDHFINDEKVYKKIIERSDYLKCKLALETVLKDTTRNSVVRHECAEALAAMRSIDSINLLEKIRDDVTNPPEVIETCHISVKRLKWAKSLSHNDRIKNKNPFTSVDPTPPLENYCFAKICNQLSDPNTDLYQRYRCAFTLRNELCSGNLENVTDQAVKSLVDALICPSSALLRHEIAYIFGQILESECLSEKETIFCVENLVSLIKNTKDHGMVRHEAAMALVDCNTPESKSILMEYSQPSEKSSILRESCIVALNMPIVTESGDNKFNLTYTQ